MVVNILFPEHDILANAIIEQIADDLYDMSDKEILSKDYMIIFTTLTVVDPDELNRQIEHFKFIIENNEHEIILLAPKGLELDGALKINLPDIDKFMEVIEKDRRLLPAFDFIEYDTVKAIENLNVDDAIKITLFTLAMKYFLFKLEELSNEIKRKLNYETQ